MKIDDQEVKILYEISKMLNSAFYRETLVSDALDLVVKVINAERALFVKYDDYDFSIIGARNVKKEDIVDLSSFSSGILQKVILHKRPYLFHDAQSDPSISQFKSIQIHSIKSIIGVPIFYRDQIWGVILADSQMNRQEFTEKNLQFLEFFSTLVSLSLDRIINYERLQDENQVLRNQLQAAQKIHSIIGESAVMRQLFTMIQKVAQTDATVLLLGDSGTGKDLFAKAIHQASLRSKNNYLAQFCGSIPDTLLESELFGYKKGAFTGATSDKKGLFEVADKGTFFLDEIADISFALQAKLLRVLQNQEIIRLGDTKVKKIDVRIIAASNKDLKQLAKKGEFREDLFYRLDVFPITIPPLRERQGDIPLLANHFLKKYKNASIHVHPDAIKKLENFSWPGNVRQLENVIQRALILTESNQILPEHIQLDEDDDMGDFQGTLAEFEKVLLKQRLKKFNANRTQTAKSLGVSLRWVQLKLKQMRENGEGF